MLAPSAEAFPWRSRMDRERMDALPQFGRKRRIDHAVAREPALSTEGLRHDMDPEMGFAALAVAGMALVTVGLVLDLETERREGFRELLRNSCPDTHEP
jgi:hypothetical protein